MSTQNDVLVVGAGLAGLTAVWQLATQQKKVRLVSKGWGATHWHSGCIDVLGYYPVDEPEPVASPGVTLAKLIADQPEHPYALVGVSGVEAALNALGAYMPGKGSPHIYAESCAAVVNFGAACEIGEGEEICRNAGVQRTCSSDSDHVFAESKALAGRSTEQFVRFVEQVMRDLDPGAGPTDKYENFWKEVKRQPTFLPQRTAQFEDFTRLGFQYSSAGEYPVMNPSTPGHSSAAASNGWYVRIRIYTSNDFLAGTDGDVALRIESDQGVEEFPLDYLPMHDANARVSSPLLVYNDFERNDDDGYTGGPIQGRPRRVTLVNGAGNAGDAFLAAGSDISSWLDGAATDIRRLVIGIVGGNADVLGIAMRSYTAEELNDRLGYGAQAGSGQLLSRWQGRGPV